MVVQGYYNSDWCGNLQQHPDQGRVAYQRTIEGTNGATPKRDAKDKAADE